MSTPFLNWKKINQAKVETLETTFSTEYTILVIRILLETKELSDSTSQKKKKLNKSTCKLIRNTYL